MAGMVRLVVLCSGTAWIGWHGKDGQGSSRYGAMWFGWRVMVRLGAVLCGSVMYGLVWLARYRMVGLCPSWWVVLRRGKAGKVSPG